MARAFPVALAALLLAACAPADTGRAEAAPGATPIADFRPGPAAFARRPTDSDSATVAAAVYGSPVPGDVALAARVDGAFTMADAAQTLYLLVREGPASGPRPARSLLAVFEGGALVAQFVPPSLSYQALAGVVDANADGIDDVIAVAQSYQMGQTSARATLLTLAGGQRRTLEDLGVVFEDSCDAPLAEGAVRAAVLA
ncbi:MAG: hypothetical protein AAGD86_00110, partial [Pseudomonadota bacterium]